MSTISVIIVFYILSIKSDSPGTTRRPLISESREEVVDNNHDPRVIEGPAAAEDENVNRNQVLLPPKIEQKFFTGMYVYPLIMPQTTLFNST